MLLLRMTSTMALWTRLWRNTPAVVAFSLESTRGTATSTSVGRHFRRRLHSTNADDAVDRHDPVHTKRYFIAGAGRKSSVQMTTDTGHALATDVPRKMGGDDAAPQPVEHLLAALLGCTQATAVYVGRRMSPRLLVDTIEFEVRAHRDERGALQLPIDRLPSVPARLQRVEGDVKVRFRGGQDAAAVSEEQLQLLAEQTEARCPVANMMAASGCEMDLRWTHAHGVDEAI